VEGEDAPEPMRNCHIACEEEAAAPRGSSPVVVGSEGVDSALPDPHLGCDDDAMVSTSTGPQDVTLPVEESHAALDDSAELPEQDSSEVEAEDSTEGLARPLLEDEDSDYEAATEESEDAVESDFEASAQESDHEAESDCDHQSGDSGSDYSGHRRMESHRVALGDHKAAKVPSSRTRATERASVRIPESRTPKGGQGMKERVSGLTRMGSVGSRSHDRAWASSNLTRTDDGAQKERRRIVSQLLKPFGRKRPSYEKGIPRQKRGKKHTFFRQAKAGRGKRSAVTSNPGARPFAAISKHLQKKMLSRPMGGSDRPSFSRKIRTGLLKRRLVPEEEHSDSDYPDHQAILDSVPSPELMQLARSIDARAAAAADA